MALKLIQKIYKIEKELRAQNLTPDVFVEKRRQLASPVWEGVHRWLKDMESSVLPERNLGKAVTYSLNEYSKLIRYLDNAVTTPDNNIAENAIRPFVIGRKNWLFCDSPKGAHASAAIYSLCETAKANNIEPQDYLFRLFEKLPQIDLTDRKALEQLLPWNVTVNFPGPSNIQSFHAQFQQGEIKHGNKRYLGTEIQGLGRERLKAS